MCIKLYVKPFYIAQPLSSKGSTQIFQGRGGKKREEVWVLSGLHIALARENLFRSIMESRY